MAIRNNLFRQQIALTNEHGSWVFFLSPLVIGLYAGERWSPGAAFLVLASLAGFLIRQPITILVKIYSRRRPRRDLAPAFFWIAVYGLFGLAALAGLVGLGFGYLLYLAIPGVGIFGWHLYLVSRRSERRQMGVEIVASGVLALIAPAAMWVGAGSPVAAGWWLWVTLWFQSAASIVYAYLRLAQRDLPKPPDALTSLRLGRRALLYTSFNLAAALGLSAAGVLPPLLFLPYSLQWVETLWGTLNPAVGWRPTAIGFRQLAVSILFTVLFLFAWSA
jgi:hypothetical protein